MILALVGLTGALAGELHEVAPADLVLARHGTLQWKADDPPKVQACAVSVALDAEGAVYDAVVDDPCERVFKEALGRTVVGWRFEPVLVDGQAVAAASRFQVFYDPSHIPEDPDAKGYTERGFQVQHADLSLKRKKMPAYPVRNRLDEDVRCTFEVRIDEKGKPYEVTAKEGCPEAYAKSGEQGVMGWRWYPPTIDGRPVGAQIVVAVNFKKR